MTLTPETPIKIKSDAGEMIETTWSDFVANNDAETVEDAEYQIEFDGYAKIGGGAAPMVWVFA